MRKVVLYTLMSLDGAVDHPARYFTPSQVSGQAPEFDSVMNDNEARIIATQDAVLLGRNTYDEWSQYWPTSNDQPFADFINSVEKSVVTSRPLSNRWRNSDAVAVRVEDLMGDLKSRSGGDIGVHGSIQLAQSMLDLGLVDELRLVMGPTIGCAGRRLFANAEKLQRLELLGAVSTPSVQRPFGLPHTPCDPVNPILIRRADCGGVNCRLADQTAPPDLVRLRSRDPMSKSSLRLLPTDVQRDHRHLEES